tara:strand:+ start:10337 stop:11032 length:696 start_codon:yes stop_codon:yes gene_type:complete
MNYNKSLIIPCKDEGENFINIYTNFNNKLSKNTEIIIVLDSDKDPTYKYIKNIVKENTKIEFSKTGGPASAIKHGIDKSSGNIICIAMGDGSDDPDQVETLCGLVERGVDIAVASRYSKGGKYIGNKRMKYYLSKGSGILLYYIFRVGTKDSTNMYKAYSKKFLEEVNIESDNGFTLGLEMITKAKLFKKTVVEVPTIWIDREFGESKFDMKKFLPSYIYWLKVLIFRRRK